MAELRWKEAIAKVLEEEKKALHYAELNTDRKNFENIKVQTLGNILEAILIESIEPRQNRKQGNLFYGLEYLQQEDPEIKKKFKEQML